MNVMTVYWFSLIGIRRNLHDSEARNYQSLVCFCANIVEDTGLNSCLNLYVELISLCQSRKAKWYKHVEYPHCLRYDGCMVYGGDFLKFRYLE